jgi:hypothetical protein
MYLILAALIGLSVAQVIPSALAVPLFLVVLLVMLGFIASPYLPPLWAGRVARNGKRARATILSNEFIHSGGADLWVTLPVEVNPEGEPAFKAEMRCKAARAAELAVGSSVSVRYDPVKKLVLLA